ncbi:MAG: hypothetical protein K8R41_13520 [Bacteroidales bacterium]|nr:hypothetical protein [Bacteroidales bacterium]
MKKSVFLILVIIFGSFSNTYSQKPVLELIFTAIDSASYLQIDSIKVMNHTQGGDTVLYWPDTVLVLEYQVGISEINNEEDKLQVFQNYPNPVKDQTTLTLYLPEKGKVNLVITDILGRMVNNTERLLERGYHSFRFTPGGREIFFFSAFWQGISSSIKILNASSMVKRASSLEYLGIDIVEPQFKSVKAIQSFVFSPGDMLLFIGYADTLQSGIPDTTENSKTFTFQFANNIPCPGSPTVTHYGQTYNTIQIFSQCWLKENLNVGTMISGSNGMINNGIIEKYCYDDDPAYCNEYGGLYQWDEMMQYTTQQGTQGICPSGWHLPTDEEWKILEGTVDSQYGIGDPQWNIYWSFRGFDAGANLKTNSGWYSGGNGTNLFGFSGMPGGGRGHAGDFAGIGENGCWWTSTDEYTGNAWDRSLSGGSPYVYRDAGPQDAGCSVRCVRNY